MGLVFLVIAGISVAPFCIILAINFMFPKEPFVFNPLNAAIWALTFFAGLILMAFSFIMIFWGIRKKICFNSSRNSNLLSYFNIFCFFVIAVFGSSAFKYSETLFMIDFDV
jgi:hypothetical protein